MLRHAYYLCKVGEGVLTMSGGGGVLGCPLGLYMYSSYSLKFASGLKTKIDEYSKKNHINLEKSLPMGGGGVVTPKHLDPPPPNEQ